MYSASQPPSPLPLWVLLVFADNGTHLLMHALRDIEAGQEITNNYQPQVIHRPDMCLHVYGDTFSCFYYCCCH